MKLYQVSFLAVAFFLVVTGAGCANRDQVKTAALKTPTVVRVGFFPNMTHAQALIGLARGTFRDAMGSDYVIETKMFNAGPSEIEALFAGEIDIGYIGPSPAVNGFLRSQGNALRIVSGAASGGESFVLSPPLAQAMNTQGPQALKGKKIATPQQGNTQDVALRHFLRENHLNGTVTIIPMANADQLLAFRRHEIDGSWSPEPWATRLEKEADGVRIFDERTRWQDGSFSTTVVIVRADFLRDHPDAVRKWIEGHIKTTEWIKVNPKEAQTLVNEELGRITSKKLSDDVMAEAWTHINFTTDPFTDSIKKMAGWAKEEGLLPDSPSDLAAFFDMPFIPYAPTATSR